MWLGDALYIVIAAACWTLVGASPNCGGAAGM